MGLAQEKKSYLQEKANLFEIGSKDLPDDLREKHMLLLGIGAMIAVGLTWLVCGIVMGRAPKENINADILIFFSAVCSFTVSLATGILRGFPLADWGMIAGVGSALLICGICSNRQLSYLSRAMQHGPNGIIWSITQSGFLVPFLVGIFFFGVPLNGWRLSGLIALLLALNMMGLAKNNGNSDGGPWKGITFAAFLITGFSQTLSNLPSYFSGADAVDSIWRTCFFSFGLLIATPCSALFSGYWKSLRLELRRHAGNRKMWIYCIYMGFFEILGSFFLLYPGMNLLARAGAGAIAYPLMVASCILGFEFYSMLFLREKRTLLQTAALLLCLFGVATICC